MYMTTTNTKKTKEYTLYHHVYVHQHTKEDKTTIYSKCYQVILYVYPQFPLHISDTLSKKILFLHLFKLIRWINHGAYQK